MRHTPGPWKITGEGMNDYEGKEIGTDDKTVAVICSADVMGDEPEDEANALLIAAAPDMLQMLQELSTWLVCPDCAPETIEYIKARVDEVVKGAVHDQTN